MAGEAGGAALGRAADKLFSLSGLFAVCKPKGPTSAAVLNLLKERLLAGERRRPSRHLRRVRARRALPGAAMGWSRVRAVLGVRELQLPANHSANHFGFCSALRKPEHKRGLVSLCRFFVCLFW